MKKATLPTNAMANAVMFPTHWKVPTLAYLEIVAVLVENCPKWAEYYKQELSGVMPLLEVLEKARKIKNK